ncbi:MAG: hypothetical protein ABSE57_30615 [Bryobacteraceae bacterium]
MATALCVISWNTNATEFTGQNWYQVNVQLNSQLQVPKNLLRDSQQAATVTFARIRVQLIWRGQNHQASKVVAGCMGEPATHDLAVEIVPHAPSPRNVALATAMPLADSGVRILVFYDRVKPLLVGHHAPEATILGYVLAHEIAHVLQGIVRHSETGIMRASWTDTDFKLMGVRLLMFTPEDAQLIRRRLAPRDATAGCS